MTPEHDILQVTPRVEALAALCRSNSRIDPALYRKYDVKRGLRDINGQGVLAGLTNISDIISRKEIGGEIVPCEGELYYRGIRIQDLVQGFIRDGRKGYEEVAYLLLFGELPDGRFQGSAGAGTHAADQFHPRCHHESADARYDEQPVAQCAHAGILRQQRG